GPPRVRRMTAGVAASEPSASVVRADDEPAASRLDRYATWAFFGYLVVALPVLLVATPDRWFLADEWDYLADRSATDLGDLFRPHNQHWSTLPILVYRGLFSVFGIRTYVPYQLVVVVLHLVACGLLWLVMRRAG